MGYLPTARNINPIQQCVKTKRSARRAILAINQGRPDFEEAPVSALQQVFGTVTVADCWFYYDQAVVKRLTKIGLRDAHLGNQDVQKIVRCLLSLPVLPPGDIVQAVSNIAQRSLMTANTWKV